MSLIDKADFRVPGPLPFTKEFARVYSSAASLPSEQANRVWKKSKFYAKAGDFTSFGYPVMLHMECTMTKKRNHKLEILQTGDKTLGEMRDICEAIFEGTPDNWGILRADLTADAEGVEVDWFKQHTYVLGKQVRRELGQIIPIPYLALSKGVAETIYAGVKPNQIRIYNKTQERVVRHGRMMRAAVRKFERDCLEGKVVEMPKLQSFEEVYGYDPSKIITRVERQLSGTDLEKVNLTTFERLKLADRIKPFEKIKFFKSSEVDLSLESWGWRDWCIGETLKREVERNGLASALKLLQRGQPSNHRKERKKFEPWLGAGSKMGGTTSAELQNEFVRSTYRQIAA